MSDIVTDLRTLATMPEYDRAANMFEQCAAEIERLRAVLTQDKPRAAWADTALKNGLLCEEIDRLREVLKSVFTEVDLDAMDDNAELQRQLSTIARLARAALANAKPEQETE